jgi:carboxylesterase type B
LKGFFSSTPMSSRKAVSPPSREDRPPSINESSPFPALDPCTSDDCLSLDVIVPLNVYNAAPQDTSGGAPAIIWIYRGGFFTEPKESQGNPAGLEANLNQIEQRRPA